MKGLGAARPVPGSTSVAGPEQSARSWCRRENVQEGEGSGMQGPLGSVQDGLSPGLVPPWAGGMHVFRQTEESPQRRRPWCWLQGVPAGPGLERCPQGRRGQCGLAVAGRVCWGRHGGCQQRHAPRCPCTHVSCRSAGSAQSRARSRIEVLEWKHGPWMLCPSPAGCLFTCRKPKNSVCLSKLNFTCLFFESCGSDGVRRAHTTDDKS